MNFERHCNASNSVTATLGMLLLLSLFFLKRMHDFRNYSQFGLY